MKISERWRAGRRDFQMNRQNKGRMDELNERKRKEKWIRGQWMKGRKEGWKDIEREDEKMDGWLGGWGVDKGMDEKR